MQKATDIHFTKEELEEINLIVPKGIAAGTRYPAQMMGSING